MSFRKLTADWVFPVHTEPLEKGVVIINEDGVVMDIAGRESFDTFELEHLNGILIPGLVNAHCHLELSHMKGVVETGMGLIPFITDVVKKREASREKILESIRLAEEEMSENGIVAVGDISNNTDSFPQKEAGQLYYHTFVEMFDFLQDKHAQSCFDDYFQIYDQAPRRKGCKTSLTPHSPYTVSPSLFRLINSWAVKHSGSISIHNQEMPDEDRFIRDKEGGLIPFYESFQIPLVTFEASGMSSLEYAIRHLVPTLKTLFVHNTMSTASDILAAREWGESVYWISCPNANLYIENRLPDYSLFRKYGARMALGTDSYTSNWQLSILEEMKTISRYQSHIPFEELLQWATIHGADALGFKQRLGTIEKGKCPGINLIRNMAYDPFRLLPQSEIVKVI